jgi:HlyD family secretion protein
MRTLLVALAGVVLFSTVILNPGNRVPTVSADSVSIKAVRADSSGALMVERPAGARAYALSGVFVVTDDGVLRRAPVRFGRASSSSIEVESGLAAGDRIIVSDMRAWDQFERLQIRSR